MKPLLHHLTARHLESASRAGSGSLVLHGPRSAGKALAARELARRLNCRGDEGGLCPPCRQLAAGSYPDFLVVQPEDRPSITIEQVRQLGHILALSPYAANGARVVMIDEAQALTVEAQNALLKLIEEPPPATRFILIAGSLEALLPTVRSRLAAIYFAPVPADAIARLLESRGVPGPEAARLAALADGVPGVAVQLAADATAAAERADLEAAATTALTAGAFDRLLLARRLADTKANLALLSRSLQRALIAELRAVTPAAAPARAAARLAALERFRRGLEANVSPRVALDRLMLEL